MYHDDGENEGEEEEALKIERKNLENSILEGMKINNQLNCRLDARELFRFQYNIALLKCL